MTSRLGPKGLIQCVTKIKCVDWRNHKIGKKTQSS